MALAAPLYGALVALAVLYKLYFGSPYSPRGEGHVEVWTHALIY